MIIWTVRRRRSPMRLWLSIGAATLFSILVFILIFSDEARLSPDDEETLDIGLPTAAPVHNIHEGKFARLVRHDNVAHSGPYITDIRATGNSIEFSGNFASAQWNATHPAPPSVAADPQWQPQHPKAAVIATYSTAESPNSSKIPTKSPTPPKTPTTPLNVFLVFHSHCDAGWLQTYEAYFEQSVRRILDNAVDFLWTHEDARFIWSEMSFLSMWWRGANSEQQSRMRELVDSRRLELTGGSWVMSDEATTHFHSSLNNIIEGHQFIRNTFGRMPTSSWSVDPFGHAATIPFLQSGAGIFVGIVGRLSRHVKEQMRDHAALRFLWSEPWQHGNETQLPYIQALPRTYYTTTDSCGPDSDVCCRYDFGPSARSTCFAGRFDSSIDDLDTAARALAGQYRQIAAHYASNTVLIPIGDDFFFSDPLDWDENHWNYRLLADYVNSNESFGMKIQFGTVSDYFEALHSDKTTVSPVLRGDFFPYTENKEIPHAYWVGYYAHRPAFKRLERRLQAKLATVDRLSVLNKSIWPAAFRILRDAHRTSALAQHHDAITGTSRPHVMNDYFTRLNDAIAQLQALETAFLHNQPLRSPPTRHSSTSSDQLPTFLIFTASIRRHSITVFNPKTLASAETVEFRVNDQRVRVLWANGTAIGAQISPSFNPREWKTSTREFDLIFVVNVEALSSAQIIVELEATQPPTTVIVPILNFPRSPSPVNADLSVNAGDFVAWFRDGQLKLITFPRRNDSLMVDISYAVYTDIGGAYVFAPAGEEQGINVTAEYADLRLIRGPIVSRVYSRIRSPLFPQTQLSQLVEFTHEPNRPTESQLKNFAVQLFTNVSLLADVTVVMNIQTNLGTDGSLWTDANGMHLVRREFSRSADVRLAANFYPATTTAMLQDNGTRLSVLLGQSTAAATLGNGHIQLFLDRTMNGDDGKGLTYGDARFSEPAHLHYVFTMADRQPASPTPNRGGDDPLFHSSAVSRRGDQLLNPNLIKTVAGNPIATSKLPTGSLADWPCDVELITARWLTVNESLFVLRRVEFDRGTHDYPLGLECDSTATASALPALQRLIPSNQKLIHTSLNGAAELAAATRSSILLQLRSFALIALKTVAL